MTPPTAPDSSPDNAHDVVSTTAGKTVGGVRHALLRGLGVVLPPLLTIVVLIWAWNAIESYVLTPVESTIRRTLVWSMKDIKDGIPQGAVIEERAATVASKTPRGFTYENEFYVPDPTGRRYLPAYVVQEVDEEIGAFGPGALAPNTAVAYWDRYVQLTWMPRWIVVPVFLLVFLSLLFFLGRMFTGGIGRWFLGTFDATILRIPIVNKVYGSVKQITDFAFDDRQIEFNRVVAIQYPREGIWSLGFVTGNSMREISEAAGEPMLSVLMPTSPMPMTGFTVTIRRSEAIDLDLTIDEAIQFIVSCGVVVPTQQRQPVPSVIMPMGASGRPARVPETSADVAKA